MSFKIAELMPITVASGGVEVICEANTSHMAKSYFVIQAHGVHVMASQDNASGNESPGRPPILSIRVCPTCMVEYMGYMNSKISELAAQRR